MIKLKIMLYFNHFPPVRLVMDRDTGMENVKSEPPPCMPQKNYESQS